MATPHMRSEKRLRSRAFMKTDCPASLGPSQQMVMLTPCERGASQQRAPLWGDRDHPVTICQHLRRSTARLLTWALSGVYDR